MTITRSICTLFIVTALAGPATGCVVYSRPPRAGVVYISARPPVDRVEVIPAAPGAGFIWIKGYWAYRGAEFAWVPGRWERPAEGRTVWVPHHWEHDSHGWFFVEGHWR